MALTFRPLERSDLEEFRKWISEPHVAKWWLEETDLLSIDANYGPAIDGNDPSELFVVERQGGPIGFAQRYRFVDNPQWQQCMSVIGPTNDACGIDYFISDKALVGMGLGTEMIAKFVERIWQDWPEIAQVVVSVQQENIASWRALEKAGFTRGWDGMIDSGLKSDAGPSYVYVIHREALKVLT